MYHFTLIGEASTSTEQDSSKAPQSASKEPKKLSGKKNTILANTAHFLSKQFNHRYWYRNTTSDR